MEIFISYNEKTGVDVARTIREKLKDEQDVKKVFDFKCPEHNPPGVPWYENIEKNISECNALVAVITQEYLNSAICYKEFICAWYKNKLVIPVFIGRKKDYDYSASYGKELKELIDKVTYVELTAGVLDAYDRILMGLRTSSKSLYLTVSKLSASIIYNILIFSTNKK